MQRITKIVFLVVVNLHTKVMGMGSRLPIAPPPTLQGFMVRGHLHGERSSPWTGHSMVRGYFHCERSSPSSEVCLLLYRSPLEEKKQAEIGAGRCNARIKYPPCYLLELLVFGIISIACSLQRGKFQWPVQENLLSTRSY